MAILAVCPGAYSLRGEEVAVLPTAAPVTSLWIVVPAQFLGACGEELGWRYLLQPLLRGRSSVLVASAAVGLLWGLWHVQIITLGLGFAAGFLVSAVALSIIMGVAIDRAGGQNLAIAAVFHLLVNLGLLFLLDEEDGDATAMWVVAASAAGLAAAWALIDRASGRPKSASVP